VGSRERVLLAVGVEADDQLVAVADADPIEN
jgi:hypothetical protein